VCGLSEKHVWQRVVALLAKSDLMVVGWTPQRDNDGANGCWGCEAWRDGWPT